MNKNTATIFGIEFELGDMVRFRNDVILPRKAVIDSLFRSFMIKGVYYTPGDKVIVKVDGLTFDFTDAHVKISDGLLLRQWLPENYITMIRDIYYSERIPLLSGKTTENAIYLKYLNKYLPSEDDEPEYAGCIHCIVEELTSNPRLRVDQLIDIVNIDWNGRRDASIIRKPDGTFAVDDDFMKKYVSTFNSTNYDTSNTALNSIDLHKSRYITIFDKHYKFEEIKELPNGKFIPYCVMVDLMAENLREKNMASKFRPDDSYDIELTVFHNNQGYELGSDTLTPLNEYRPRRLISTEMIALVAYSHRILRLYVDITKESLYDMIADYDDYVITECGNDAFECITFCMDAFHFNRDMSMRDMIKYVNIEMNRLRDDVIVEKDGIYSVDTSYLTITEDYIDKSLRYLM